MTNRFCLGLKANALEDTSVKARLIMCKVWPTSSSVNRSFFADKASESNDGTMD